MRLAERELLDRGKRAAERRIGEADFPVIKTMDTYDFKAQPSVNERLIRELMRGEYIDKKENVLCSDFRNGICPFYQNGS